MKKSKKFVTLFAIMLVLALCLSTFAACGAKKTTMKNYQEQLVGGINRLIPENGYYFGIDAAASYTYEKDKESIRYDVIIKGTLDTDKNAESADNQLQLELKETKNGVSKTLFALYYKDQLDKGAAEYADNAPKLFININEQYKFAFNTYSIKKAIKDAPTTATSDMLDIAGFELSPDNIVGALLTFISVEDSFKVKNVKKEVHMTCELNLQKLMDTTLSGLIGDNAEVIDGVLGQIGSDLTAEKLKGIDLNIPMTLTVRYTKVKKNQTPKLLGGSLAIDFNKDRPIKIVIGGETLIDTAIPKCKVTIGIDKVEILSGQKVEINTPTDGYTMINPLNLSLDAKLNITNDTGVVTPYDVIFRANVNPFPIAYGFNGWDIKEAVFKNLGMLHFSIISPDRQKAIIDLAFDPKNTGSDSVFASLNLGSLGKISTQLSLSSLEGLLGEISAFIGTKDSIDLYPNKKPPATTLTNQADGTVNNWLEALKPAITDLLTGSGIIDIVKLISPTMTEEQIAELKATLAKVATMVNQMITDGNIKLGTVERPTQSNVFVEVSIKKIASAILGSGIIPSIGEDVQKLIDSLLGMVDEVLGGSILNLEFTGISYGTVKNDYSATRFFSANGRGDSSFIKGIDDFNNPIVSSKMKLGITAADFMSEIYFGKSIPMKYENYKGGKAQKAMKVMMVSGFDKTKTGTQTVTIGFMDESDQAAIKAILKLVGGLIKDEITISKIPFGLIRYTFDVKII